MNSRSPTRRTRSSVLRTASSAVSPKPDSESDEGTAAGDLDIGAPQQAAHVPHGLLGRVGHFHARHPAGLGQRAQERRNLQFRQLRHQLDQPLRRPYFEALHGLPEGAPHPPVEQRPRNPRPGIPRGRRSGCQLVVRQPYGNLRERIHQGLAARLAAQDRTDRGRGDRKGALRQRRRHPRIPQVAGHRPGHAVPAIQGRRSAGGKDQARQHGIPWSASTRATPSAAVRRVTSR